jgi:hypothetical protein
MYRVITSLALFTVIGICTTAQESKKNSKTNSAGTSMTGCIDEDNGRYVLINDRTRVTIANLEAENFPTEGFAKHLGHKVTVRGTVNSGGDVPLFRVRSIETISEACEPQPHQ